MKKQLIRLCVTSIYINDNEANYAYYHVNMCLRDCNIELVKSRRGRREWISVKKFLWVFLSHNPLGVDFKISVCRICIHDEKENANKHANMRKRKFTLKRKIKFFHYLNVQSKLFNVKKIIHWSKTNNQKINQIFVCN